MTDKDFIMLHRKSIVVFLIIAFSLAWALFVLPLAFRKADSSTRQAITLVCWSAAMWAPGLAAILTNYFVDREPMSKLHLNRLGDRRSYLLAWLVPPLLVIAAGILTAVLGVGQLDLEFTAVREAMAQSSNSALPPGVVVGIQMLFALTLAPLFNSLFALGEELGWRGYLLPKLIPLGQGRAILLSGIIWGVWHWPAILQGHNYPNQPVLGMFLMIGFCVLFGAFLSWLYLRTGSPWAPALGHGALNAFAGFPLIFIPGVNMALGGTLTSLVGWIPMILLVGWLIWKRDLLGKETEARAEPLAV
jgi:membrane protease YdiL (CAAX protease family)